MNSSQNLALNPNPDLAAPSPSQDLTLNQINDILMCLHEAKAFLQKNSKEQKTTVAHIYNLFESILQSLISQDQIVHDRSGQNKILHEYQKNAIHQFI